MAGVEGRIEEKKEVRDGAGVVPAVTGAGRVVVAGAARAGAGVEELPRRGRWIW